MTISLPSSSVAKGTMVSSTFLAELQFRGVVLGEPALDADHVVELNQADAERDEVLARWGPCTAARAGSPELSMRQGCRFGAAAPQTSPRRCTSGSAARRGRWWLRIYRRCFR